MSKSGRWPSLSQITVGALVLTVIANRAGIYTLRRHKHNESGEVVFRGSTSMTTSNSTSHPKNIFVGGRMIGMSTSTTTSSSSSHPVNLYRN